MKWQSHIAINTLTVAVFDLSAIPFAILGAVFPDFIETFLRQKHRSKHYLLLYLLACIPAFFVHKYLFFFVFSAFLHVLEDAFTVSGVKMHSISKRPTSFGSLRTGSPMEYFIVFAICIPLIYLIFLQLNSGFLPFFYNWYSLYDQGIVDAFELKKNRFNFF